MRAALLVLPAIAVYGLTELPAGADTTRCAPARSEFVLARGSENVVLERRVPASRGGLYVSSRTCNTSTGRSGRLTYLPFKVQVSGRFAAFSTEDPSGDCGFGGLVIVNTRTGAEGAVDDERCGYETQFRSFVLRSSGALAWKRGRRIFTCAGACRAAAIEPTRFAQPTAVVTRNADPRSLRLTRTGISWRERGRRRTARLP